MSVAETMYKETFLMSKSGFSILRYCYLTWSVWYLDAVGNLKEKKKKNRKPNTEVEHFQENK